MHLPRSQTGMSLNSSHYHTGTTGGSDLSRGGAEGSSAFGTQSYCSRPNSVIGQQVPAHLMEESGRSGQEAEGSETVCALIQTHFCGRGRPCAWPSPQAPCPTLSSLKSGDRDNPACKVMAGVFLPRRDGRCVHSQKSLQELAHSGTRGSSTYT